MTAVQIQTYKEAAADRTPTYWRSAIGIQMTGGPFSRKYCYRRYREYREYREYMEMRMELSKMTVMRFGNCYFSMLSLIVFRSILSITTYLRRPIAPPRRFFGLSVVPSAAIHFKFLTRPPIPDPVPILQKTPLNSFREIIDIVIRVVQISIVIVPALLTLPFAILCRGKMLKLWSGFFLVRGIGSLGPTWIKIGQWASTRPDIVPDALISELSVFHHHAPTHPVSYSISILESALGGPLPMFFSSFDSNPIGSGSMAQVHKATLLKSGHDVAIKILHPHIEDYLELDLRLLSSIVGIIEYVFPSIQWIGLSDEVHQFGTALLSQADMRVEAGNLARFISFFRGYEDKIGFPKPLFATKDILVESFEEGITIGSLLEPSKPLHSFLYEQVVSTAFSAFLKMTLLDNFTHADLHPGNLLVQFKISADDVGEKKGFIDQNPMLSKFRADLFWIRALLYPYSHFKSEYHKAYTYYLRGQKNKPQVKHSLFDSTLSWGISGGEIVTSTDALAELDTTKIMINPKLVFIDAGLITKLSAERFKNFLDLFKTIILWRDGYSAGKMLIERSPYSSVSPVDEEEFCQATQYLVQDFFTSHPIPRRSKNSPAGAIFIPLGQYHMGPILRNMLSLVRKHHIRLDDQYTNLIMSMVFVEGLGRSLCPQLDLLPFLKQAAVHYFLKA